MNKKTVINKLHGITLGVLLACSSMATAEEAAVQQFLVDDNKIECPGAQFSSIQAAIDAAGAGSEIKICAGTYNEQVKISKSVKLIGEAGAVIMPTDMKVNAENIAMYEDMAAAISVKGAANVSIEGLTIDGSKNGISNCSAELVGIVCEDMSGKIQGITIRNMDGATSSAESCQAAYGIFAQSSDSGETDVKVQASTIDGCRSGAIVGNNLGTVLRAEGNTISSISKAADTNGLKLEFGAIGTSKGNSIAAIQ